MHYSRSLIDIIEKNYNGENSIFVLKVQTFFIYLYDKMA